MLTHLFLPLMATPTSLSACTHIYQLLYILLPVCRVIRPGHIQRRAPTEVRIRHQVHSRPLSSFDSDLVPPAAAVTGNAYSFHSFQESGGGCARAFCFLSFAHLLVATASWSGLVSRSSRVGIPSVRKRCNSLR